MIGSIFRTITILFILLASIVIFLLTPSGLRVSMNLVAHTVPGELHYQKVSGLLTGPISISNFHYHYQHVDIKIEHLYWQWQFRSLLIGHLNIKKLHAEHVRIVLPLPQLSILQRLFTMLKEPKHWPEIGMQLHKIMSTWHFPINITIEQADVYDGKIRRAKPNSLDSLYPWVQFLPTLQARNADNVLAHLLEEKTYCSVRDALHGKKSQCELHPQPKKLIAVITTNPVHFPFHISALHLSAFIKQRSMRIQIQSDIEKPKTVHVSLRLFGSLSNYTLQLLAQHSHYDWNLNASGTDKKLEIHLNENQDSVASAQTDLSVEWFPIPIWALQIQTHRFDFHLLNDKWPKQVNLQLQGHGKVVEHQPTFTFNSQSDFPGTAIKLNISQDPDWNVLWNIETNQLKSFLPLWSGKLKSQGTLKGSFAKAITTGSFSATNLKSSSAQIQSLQSQWNIDSTNHQSSNATLKASNIAFQHFTISSLQSSLTGKLDDHDLQVAMIKDGNQLNFHLKGGISEKIWKGQLSALQLLMPQKASWNLTHSSPIVITSEGFSLQSACFQSSIGGQICTAGTWEKDKPWSFTLQGQALPFKLLSFLFPATVQLDGNTEIKGLISGFSNQIQNGQLKLKLLPGKINYTIENKQIQNPYQGGEVNALWTPAGLVAKIFIDVIGADDIRATITIPNFPANKSFPISAPPVQSAPVQHTPFSIPIQGNIQTHLYHLRPWSTLIPYISIPDDFGHLTSSLQLTGTLTRPVFTGKTVLTEGKMNIPALNLTLTNVTLEIDSQKDTLIYQGVGYSNLQQVRIYGKTSLNLPNKPTDLRIIGDNILIMNTPEYIIYASPNISLHIENKNINITGELFIPQAEIKPFDFRNVVTLPEPDMIFIGGPVVKQEPWTLTAHLLIRFGDDVHIDTSGVVGDLEGEVLLLGEPHQTTLAEGKISIRNGSYSTYGHVLDIDPHSYIEYAQTPLNNPILFIDASKSITITPTEATQQLLAQRYTVGVNIRGSYYNPQLTLFSVPSDLSQAEIMSQLILGDSNNTNAPSGNAHLLSNKADKLHGAHGIARSAMDFFNNIKRGLGFSELGIVQEKTVDAIGNPLDQQTAFVIGRHLSKRLYLRYSQSLEGFSLTGNNEVTLRYLFKRHWALQVINNTLGTGVDILYTIEKN